MANLALFSNGYPIQLKLLWLVAVSFFVSRTGVCHSQDQIAEPTTFWYGKMAVEGRQFRFIVTAKPSSSDQVEATLQSLDEGDAKFSLTNYVADETKLEFDLPASQARYRGPMDETTGVSNGTWEQRNLRIPLRFERRDEHPQDVPSEVWEGTLNVGFQKLLMRLRVYHIGDGKTEYFVDSVSQKVGGFIAKGTIADQSFSLDIPALKGKFEGEFTSDGESIKGKWSQGLPLELEWKKVAAPTSPSVATPKRPQNPQPPFPYRTVEVSFPSAEPETNLSGTLTLPENGDKFPLAILISGSGPQDRDSTLFDHKPFWVLADHLTRRGMAVLRYDERGVGNSAGDHATATTKDLADDVAAAVRFARTRTEIHPEQIGLIGHSEGGMIAPMVAAQDPDIAWIILMAGPGVNGEQILYSQGQLIVAAEGGDAKAMEMQRTVQEHLFAAIKENSTTVWDKTMLDKVSEDLEQKILAKNPELSDEERNNLKVGIRSGLAQINSPWFRFFLTYEPAPTLQKVRCPVLAINGGHDLQVDPKLNLPKIETALKEGGNHQVTIRELPALNHLFQTCDNGAISKYATIEETLAPLLLETIDHWLQQHR
ncbi:MAG: alpha/beta fold hydrolase [Planctomycetaceae bacterium]|nr:alpha/beta fold hydrolase [Planctomycetaceae bacterium]